MTAAVTEAANERSVPDTMALLLREYSDRLKSLIDHGFSLRESSVLAGEKVNRTELDRILNLRVDQIRSQIRLTEGVIRRVSQFVSHGEMDETTRMLLELRLRELEESVNYSRDFAEKLT